MKNYKLEIDFFITFFRLKVKQIWKLEYEGDEPDRVFKKALFFSVIDSLSKCIYPRKGNRDRIVTFIDDFSEWRHRHRVSLPHLVQMLTKTPEPSFLKLRKFVLDQFKNWESGEIVGLERDPEFKEVRMHWPSEKENQKLLNGINAEALKHIQLWDFRDAP